MTGYFQSPIPPGSTIHPLPTIHVEGESIGSDRSPHDVRRVKGAVGMIGDGAIRCSLVSRTVFRCVLIPCVRPSLTRRCPRRRAPASRSGRRRRCRSVGQARRWGCWDCGPVHCMRGRIRLVSAAVLLCMGFLADTSGRRSILGLEGRLKSGRYYGYVERCANFSGVLAF